MFKYTTQVLVLVLGLAVSAAALADGGGQGGTGRSKEPSEKSIREKSSPTPRDSGRDSRGSKQERSMEGQGGNG